MKKAIVVGGCNGIGLAITINLLERGYDIELMDIALPGEPLLSNEKVHYTFCDLRYFEEELFRPLVSDKNVEILIITAGIGRIADFEYLHIAEIEKILTIDTVSTIKIFRVFFDRIKSKETFYSGVMGSISGWLSSPSAAVYSAAKAGIARFVESINIELEAVGCRNRILNISPASFSGSKFYGGENDLSQLNGFANEIITHLFARETLFIPHYQEIFQDIFSRYYDDPHAYGLYSYQYKKESGRLDNSKKVIIGYLSGTFDLFHIGHLNLLKCAKGQCDYLIVGVHDSGKWKGKETFIPLEDRKKIVGACQYVDQVVDSCLEDSDAWKLYHYDRLFVGSDYKGTLRFQKYEEYFADKEVEIVYFPYTQSTSSTQIRKMVLMKTRDIKLEEGKEL